MAVFFILAAVVLAALVALVLWGANGPPTRPRPRSRYRGPTFTEVDRRLRRMRRR